MPETPHTISNRPRGPQRVYVLHPYRGRGLPGEREANMARIADICLEIARLGHIPISPVHALSFLDDTDPSDRATAIRLCGPYIEMADTVWAYIVDDTSPHDPGVDSYGLRWVESEGCRADHAKAKRLDKSITYHAYARPVHCTTSPQGV